MANLKCPICSINIQYKKDMIHHIGMRHKSSIPDNMSPGMYLFSVRNGGRTEGSCRTCGNPTSFNEQFALPNVFCDNPKCKQAFSKLCDERMMKVYNTTSLLKDQTHQMYMLSKRKISGEYLWSDGKTRIPYVGSYELKFLKFLDFFMDLDPKTIHSPCPIHVPYEYNGEMHMHTPDLYIDILDLIVEIKHGGANPNNHPKIQAVDVAKDKAKEEAIRKLPHNYIKVTDNNFGKFLKDIFLYVENVNYGNKQRLFIINESDIPDELQEGNQPGETPDNSLYMSLYYDSAHGVTLDTKEAVYFKENANEKAIFMNNAWKFVSGEELTQKIGEGKVFNIKYTGDKDITKDIARFKAGIDSTAGDKTSFDTFKEYFKNIFANKDIKTPIDIVLDHDFTILSHRGGLD